MSDTIWRPFSTDFRWKDVDVLEYKNDESSPFKDVTRQVLFEHPNLACQWRYFEVAAGGYSTLERHGHLHAVMILRGRGRCLVGDQVRSYPVGSQLETVVLGPHWLPGFSPRSAI